MIKTKIIFALLVITLLSFPVITVHTQTPEIFTKTLQLRSTGGQVRALQELLKQFPDIYPEGLVTGYFGSPTKNAVIRFQIKEGIRPEDALGIVDQITRAKLNALAEQGIPGFPDTGTLLALATSTFTQTINPGTLSVDIVDGSYVSVGSPSVAMGAVSFSFACQTATGVFGTATQNIYVKNPDAADNGWVVSLAASAPTAYWASAGTNMDFNDPTTVGCTDGADADSLRGQMTVDPSVGTITAGQCLSCATTSITKGSSSAFNEGTVDSITILTGATASADIGDWKLTGVSISQKIPPEQPAASDYSISLTLTIVAS